MSARRDRERRCRDRRLVSKNANLPDASKLAALFVFFIRHTSATQIFLAVEGAARILDQAQTLIGVGASDNAVLAIDCAVAADESVANLSVAAHGVDVSVLLLLRYMDVIEIVLLLHKPS